MPTPPASAAQLLSLSDFDYELPSERIAQHPSPQRRDARLLDATGSVARHGSFGDLPGLLRRGDLLVLNDTRVLQARLLGEKATGGKVEMLVERILGGNQVAAHLRCSRKPEAGSSISLASASGISDGLRATLLGRWPDAEGALFRLVLSNDAGDDAPTLLEKHGHVPLPPYITHADSPEDRQRYQTVFAKHPGAVAAPTAALHFDAEMLATLQAMGVQLAYVTLHVGAGTFQPVKTERLSDHRMHSEWYDVPVATQQAVDRAQSAGGRVVAVGTTSVRALESWAASGLAQGETSIFITPGFSFRLVDLLITNFHLPRSSLMMLVSAFAGHARIRAMYALAIAENYRFFSYGDAMLLARANHDHPDGLQTAC
jgi:S-adenosylmethionine:tRNA ribosyltransferase-isomerase